MDNLFVHQVTRASPGLELAPKLMICEFSFQEGVAIETSLDDSLCLERGRVGARDVLSSDSLLIWWLGFAHSAFGITIMGSDTTFNKEYFQGLREASFRGTGSGVREVVAPLFPKINIDNNNYVYFIALYSIHLGSFHLFE